MSNSKVSEGNSMKKYIRRADKLYGQVQVMRSTKNEFKTFAYDTVVLPMALEAVSNAEAACEMHIMNLDPDSKARKKAKKHLERLRKQKVDLEYGYYSTLDMLSEF